MAMDTILSAWLIFLSGVGSGIDTDALLLPAASEQQIGSLEEAIDFQLPKDLSDVYLISNGQTDPYAKGTSFNGQYIPLFGQYEFLSLDQVRDAYKENLEWYEPGEQDQPVRDGDPVNSVYWQPGWIPFAVANAAYYAVDMTPEKGGEIGQVIEFGHDTSQNRVLAPSLSVFLQSILEKLDPEEPHRLQGWDVEDKVTGVLRFRYNILNVDWTEPPFDPTSVEPYPQPDWLVEWNNTHHENVRQFIQWLRDRGFQEDDLDTVESWVFGQSMSVKRMTGGGVFAPSWDDPNGFEIYNDMSDDLDYLMSLEIALREPVGYIVNDLPMSLEDAFKLVHEYKLEQGWKPAVYTEAQRLVDKQRPPRSQRDFNEAQWSFSGIEKSFFGAFEVCFTKGYGDERQIDCQKFKEP